ncbi:MAG: glycosyltransferase family 39 protein [Acidobacteria bacterium]|nr:glycosyltransferase family 39 protein [Acidobacteriota bacterium]
MAFDPSSGAGAGVTSANAANSSLRSAPPAESDAVRWARRLILLIILLAAWNLRASNLRYSTAYMDETIYVVYGDMFLHDTFEKPLENPMQWSFGWYLWPVAAYAAERVGGIPAVRALSALLGVFTVLAVYGIGRRLFSAEVGLAAAAVFTFLAPAVYAFRIATRDSSALFFFAMGLWLFVRAWQEREDRAWFGAALCFFAAFLCKYIVALYFPFLALISFREGRKPLRFFIFPLVALCAFYGAYYMVDLYFLVQYGRGYESLRVSAGAAREIYVTQRLDFWALLLMSLFAWRRPSASLPTASLGTGRASGDPARARVAGVLWLGVFLALLFQWTSRADYNWWKHVNYALLFVTPLAVEGVLSPVRRWMGSHLALLGTVLSVTVLSATLGWAGGLWKPYLYVFWPNVEPELAWFEGRLTPESKLLMDDTVFRHYFHPLVPQASMADPFTFEWGNTVDAPAYAAAIREGFFDYIILDGGIGEDARRLQMVAHATLKQRYALRMSMPDPVRGQRIEIYERTNPPVVQPPAPAVRIEIQSPANGELVRTESGKMLVTGQVTGAASGARVQVEVFTNNWYPQGEPIAAAGGSFRQTVFLGGEGAAQCHHLLRARLIDSAGKSVASDFRFGIVRALPDGSPPPCRGGFIPPQ